MFRLTIVVLRCMCFCTVVLATISSQGQQTLVPKLGAEVPEYLLSSSAPHHCLTEVSHSDPCASVTMDKKTFVIAWDERTHVITYIFTKDTHFLTDSELSVGGLCLLVDESGRTRPTMRYMDWLISPMWKDTNSKLSGDAIWYALLRRSSNSDYAHIVGFVQSRYINLKRHS